MLEWITKEPETLWMVVVSTAIIYGALIVFTRLAGLRSFSKMSSFDFATTIAMGSVIASSAVAKDPPVLQGIVALAAIFVLQFIVAKWRHSQLPGAEMFDNEPLLLMDGEEFLEKNMKSARITKEDIYGKLREANVLELSEVRAVVLETTGDVSVLHASDASRTLAPEIMSGVRRSADD